MQGWRWGSPWKIPCHPRAASGAGPAASARAVEQSPRPAQAHTDKQSEPHVQPGAAPPARPHGHTMEGTCWGALCWHCAWSGLPTASDSTGEFPGLGLAPCPCGCWETSYAGRETGQPLLDQDMGWGCCSPPAPNPNTLSGHLGDAQASSFPSILLLVLLLSCQPGAPTHVPGAGTPMHPNGRVIPGHWQPWLLLKSYSDCQVLGDSVPLPTQLSLCRVPTRSAGSGCSMLPSDGDVLLSHI